ncbi:FAD-dependent oxidoreductase [Propylenella binzhouense]|uniref:FAD-dependent oxidoreductase n=1 Tax=Propylenella binzhouense TaxID=2555902 RepID=A0A964T258_9HYPH|nr:FAD-dependent oxidoreductase [Propylenella binzhouense]MYZ46559.1 FAD-dependent oxidoreductase [Propylenella binzhouense]
MSNYDVIVLGGGLAGYCAALSAAEEGATVLLAEKCDEGGGSTVLSGGFMAFADTALQRELGVSDSPELLLEDLRSVGGPHAQEDLLRTYAAEQTTLFGWLTAKRLRFEGVELAAGQSAPRSHSIDPGQLILTLHELAQANGNVTIRTGTTGVYLLREGENGRIRGVTVEESGRLEDVEARCGVVIATGGFSRSERLLQTFAPQQARALRVGGVGNVGDGLRMAWRHGADLHDMGEVKGTYGVHATECNNGQEILLIFYRGAIIVNREGRRFTDESVSYKLIGDAAMRQDSPVTWQIFDKKIFDGSIGAARLFDAAAALNRGLLIKADSLQSLAEQCGIDPQGLLATVASYNEDARSGRDEAFGRDGLCHHVGALVPLDQPPFFAYPSAVAVLATYCGLRIDAKARVIDVYEEPIEGLYAAGEVTGGFHGKAYMTGTSLGKSAVFGRLAGREAARTGRA